MYGIYDGSKVIGMFTAPMTVKTNQPVFVSDSLSLKRTRIKRTPQRWEITTNVRPETRDANDLMVALIKSGYTSTLDILMPQNTGSAAKRVPGTTPTATGSLNSESITVTTTSFIPAGTFIRFGNHSKIYVTLADRSGNGSVAIYPGLRVAITNQSFTWKDDVIMPAFVELESTVGMVYSDGVLMDLGVMKFVEAL